MQREHSGICWFYMQMRLQSENKLGVDILSSSGKTSRLETEVKKDSSLQHFLKPQELQLTSH